MHTNSCRLMSKKERVELIVSNKRLVAKTMMMQACSSSSSSISTQKRTPTNILTFQGALSEKKNRNHFISRKHYLYFVRTLGRIFCKLITYIAVLLHSMYSKSFFSQKILTIMYVHCSSSYQNIIHR